MSEHNMLDTSGIPDFELVHVDIVLATIFGLNEAIVLDRIKKNCAVSDIYHKGYKWTTISVTHPAYYYLGFLTPSSLRRALSSLKIKKVVLSAQLDDDPMVRTNSYRVDYQVLSDVVDNWNGVSSEHKGNARHIPNNLKQKILCRDDHTCKKCGDKENLSIDHILPVAKGGVSKEHNLQILCMSCNIQKGTKTMEDWEASK